MKNIFDRRKFNFNLMIMILLLFLFAIILYNQRLIINTHDHVVEIDEKIDQYFAPINDVELPCEAEQEPPLYLDKDGILKLEKK